MNVKSSWHTTIRKKLTVGDSLVLLTLFGKEKFKITNITKTIATAETKHTFTYLEKVGKNVWRYNHFTAQKGALGTITIVD